MDCVSRNGDWCAGDWDAAGKRDAARPSAADKEDEDAFGEFEDLETGLLQLSYMPCMPFVVHWCCNMHHLLLALVVAH